MTGSIFGDMIFGLLLFAFVAGLFSMISPYLGAFIMAIGIIYVAMITLRDLGVFAILPKVFLAIFIIFTIIWITRTIIDARKGIEKGIDIKGNLKVAGAICALILMSVMSAGFAEVPMTGIFYIIGESSILPGFLIAAGIGLIIAAIKQVAEIIISKKFIKNNGDI